MCYILILQPRLQAPRYGIHLTDEQLYQEMVNLICQFTLHHVIYPEGEFFDNDGTLADNDLAWWQGSRNEQPPNNEQGCGIIV